MFVKNQYITYMDLQNLKITPQNLSETARQRYNKLVDRVIYDVEVSTNNNQVTLNFITDKGNIPIQFTVGSGSISAADVSYDDPSFNTVKEALDEIFYEKPNISFSSDKNLKLYEVGDSTALPFTLTATGTRTKADLNKIEITFNRNGSNQGVVSSNTPANPDDNTVSTNFDSTTWNSNNPGAQIINNQPIYFQFSSRVEDDKGGVTNSGNKTLRYVYPIYYGSSTTDFTTLSSQSSKVSFITSLNKEITTEPNYRIISHSDDTFTYFAIPQSYGHLSDIEDGVTNFSYGYDTASSPTSSEWREHELTLSTSKWSSVSYYIYKSKVKKPALKLKYIF